MLKIICKGTPYEIGYEHGTAARSHITRCIRFYSQLFLKNCQQQWNEVLETARSFETNIKMNWPRYHEEMRGIADGSACTLLDIVALNVRTEIAFGQFSDGCTSLYWRTEKQSLLGQNWDWETEQKENLILLTIHSNGLPTIKMVTEAGLIGKIGLNSTGVGVCLNAIRVRGCNEAQLPVHLGLRMALECTSMNEVVEHLKSFGLASSAHILVGDQSGGIGLEFTSSTFGDLPMDAHGRIYHSNHLLGSYPGVYEPGWLVDSGVRLVRIQQLTEKLNKVSNEPSLEKFGELFEDEHDFPCSINRSEETRSDCATLFNIVMNLKAKRGMLRLGRPSQAEEVVHLCFDDDEK